MAPTQQKTAEKRGASRNGVELPRLGSAKAPRAAKVKRETVEIPDRGVSVVLQSLSVDTFIEAQDEMDDVAKGTRGQFESGIRLVAKMLVEPEMTSDELREEVGTWTASDWLVLQNAALGLSGLREEAVAAATAAFQQAGQ